MNRLVIQQAQTPLENDEIKAQLFEYVQNILDDIDEAVTKAKNACLLNTTVTIPVIFDVSFLTKDVAQKRVYFYLLKALRDNGYNPSIQITGRLINEQKVWLKVSWQSSADEQLDAYQDKYIRSHLKNVQIQKNDNVLTDTPKRTPKHQIKKI